MSVGGRRWRRTEMQSEKMGPSMDRDCVVLPIVGTLFQFGRAIEDGHHAWEEGLLREAIVSPSEVAEQRHLT